MLRPREASKLTEQRNYTGRHAGGGLLNSENCSTRHAIRSGNEEIRQQTKGRFLALACMPAGMAECIAMQSAQLASSVGNATASACKVT